MYPPPHMRRRIHADACVCNTTYLDYYSLFPFFCVYSIHNLRYVLEEEDTCGCMCVCILLTSTTTFSLFSFYCVYSIHNHVHACMCILFARARTFPRTLHMRMRIHADLRVSTHTFFDHIGCIFRVLVLLRFS